MIRDISLFESFKIQVRVIGALVMRETLTRYSRDNIGFLWLFVEPMLVTSSISLLWIASQSHQAFKLPITAFILTGYSSLLLWRSMTARCSGAIAGNISLLYHHNVRILDLFISRIILEFVGVSISFVFLMLMFISIGWMEPPVDILTVVIGWLILAWFGASLGLVIGCLGARYVIVEKIWKPLSYFLTPFTGLSFMVDWLPTNVRTVALYFPMVHGVEIVRVGYFGKFIHAHYDIGYACFICLCLNCIGLLLAAQASKKVRPS